MHPRRAALVVSAVFVLAANALAQEKPRPKDPPPTAKAPPAAPKPAPAADDFFAPPPSPKLPASARDFQPAPAALPKHVKLAEGMPVAGPKAEKLWGDPAAKGLVDPPKAKHAFALEAEGGKPGTVFVYEYEKSVPSNLGDYLLLLFTQVLDGAPSERHPEQHFAAGRYAFVLSFPFGDPAAEWFKQHLRETCAVPAPVVRPESEPVRRAMSEAVDEEDPAKGLAAFAAKEADASKSAECLRMAALFCRWKEDWAGAEKHYRAAWELVRTLRDPLDAAKTYEVATWLGYSALHLGKHADAIAAFRTAKKFGIPNDVEGSAVWGPYNLCCALAKAGRADEAVAELKEAVAANAEIKAHAREDGDLESLRKREDVQKLLAE